MLSPGLFRNFDNFVILEGFSQTRPGPEKCNFASSGNSCQRSTQTCSRFFFLFLKGHSRSGPENLILHITKTEGLYKLKSTRIKFSERKPTEKATWAKFRVIFKSTLGKALWCLCSIWVPHNFGAFFYKLFVHCKKIAKAVSMDLCCQQQQKNISFTNMYNWY